jgi:3-oxoacyl-[acyl-carrier protein] reductase
VSVAIVTGAGRGIGRAVAETLAARGYDVVVNDLGGVAGDRAVVGDVADPAVAQRLAAFRPDVLVNNAGFIHQAPVAEMRIEDFDRMIAVHLRGTFLCTRAVLGPMLARGTGSIVNVASQLGQIGAADMAHYSAAKAGIIGFTKAVAREVAGRGVRVNAVAPGPISTDLVMALPEDWRREKAASLPLGRFGEPREVAETVAFLCSDAAALYVGQTLGPNSGDVML